MPLLEDILVLPSPMVMAVIDRIAKEASDNQILKLVILHGARGLSKLRIKNSANASSVRGLRLAAGELVQLIETVKKRTTLLELEETKHFCHYDTFRRILERERSEDSSPKQRTAHYRFLALLLLYLLDRYPTCRELATSIPIQELFEFNIEHYVRRLMSASEIELNEISFSASPAVHNSRLMDVLKTDFFIETPADRAIASQFKTSPTRPASYLCYRFTTRQNFRRKADNKITKSFLQVFEPSGSTGLFSFRHRYQDEDTVQRHTNGVVLRLPEAFYLGGTSRRGNQNFAIGVKVIAIPAGSLYQKHNHDFMCGVFLSTDSALNPIVGRLLLVRTPDNFDEDSAENYKRIPDRDFISDVHKFAAGRDFLDNDETKWLDGAIRNYEPTWGGKLNTSILSNRRVAKT